MAPAFVTPVSVPLAFLALALVLTVCSALCARNKHAVLVDARKRPIVPIRRVAVRVSACGRA
jgi:hypothetical protein